MEFERSPVTKCKSRIDGKLISVRHAVEGDMLYISEKLKELGIRREAGDYSKYVVADQDGKLLGFGYVDSNGGGASSFGIHLASEHRYLAPDMARHLADYPQR